MNPAHVVTGVSNGSQAAQIIEHQVRTGEADRFRSVVHALIEAARGFPGYVGVDVGEPPDDQHGQSSWRIVVRFQNEEQLRSWRGSTQAQRWQRAADALTIGAPRIERANGLETWFALPSRDTAPPPKWKTAVTSAIGIYPLLLIVPSIFGPLTKDLPIWLATIISVIVMSPLITWVVMPIVSRIFRSFLYARG